MSKERENIVEEEEIIVEAEEIIEEENETKISKVLSGIRKHGKKIAVGAVVAAGTLIGYALVKGSKSDVNYIGCSDEDPIDVTDSYEEVND